MAAHPEQSVATSLVHCGRRYCAQSAQNRPARVGTLVCDSGDQAAAAFDPQRAFEHAVRLPLHRVHELKSGGVASVLREDAGAVGDLIFGMLYNPWRAVVQLCGSLVVLAWADWRLAARLTGPGSPDLHHAPHLDQSDSPAAQGDSPPAGIDRRPHDRIVQRHARRWGFSREHSEAGRFIRSNDLMARQELLVWWWARIVEICWEALIPVCTGILMLYGGWQVLNGT